MICKRCGAQLPEGVAFCTSCGWKVPLKEEKPKNKKSNAGLYVLLVIIFLMLVGLSVYVLTDGFSFLNSSSAEPELATPTETKSVVTEPPVTAESESPSATLPSVTATPSADQNEWALPAGTTVEDQVLWIRGIYNEIMTNITNGTYSTKTGSEGETRYYDGADLKCVTTDKNKDGLLYDRMFYYADGDLIFAYYEAEDAHRLYFYNGKMIRWRYCSDKDQYDQATNRDLDDASDYLSMEIGVLTAGRSYLYD